MMVVVIKYVSKYDDCEDIVGVAANRDIANKYVKDLQEKYPYAYGTDYGTYYFDEHEVIV